MPDDLKSELAALGRLTVNQLRQRYEELFGQPSHSRNRRYLQRRIAWRLQVLRDGDVSQRALRRAEELVCEAELRLTAPRAKNGVAKISTSTSDSTTKKGRASLSVGTVISRRYKGQLLVVRVSEEGFVYQGETYKSLTAVARVISGAHWNGYHFFGIRKGPQGS